MKNEHSMTDNQAKPQGAAASLNTSAATPKKEEPKGKERDKEKTKRRQGAHSAGAGRNR